MGTPVVLKNFSDTFVAQNYPSRNYSTATRTRMAATGTSAEMRTYEYWVRPFNLGVTIISAKLYFYNAKAISGTATVTTKRLTQKVSMGQVNWTNRPTSAATSVPTVAKTDPAAGTLWEVDIKTLMQSVANGTAWYGIELSISGSTSKVFHSSNSEVVAMRPYVVIEYAEAPKPPVKLNPSGDKAVSVAKPVLSFDYVDAQGDNTMVALEIRYNTVNDFNTSTSLGEIATTVPEFDLAPTSFPGMTSGGASYYWWVRTKDDTLLWSAWSAAAKMRRVDFGSLAMNNPAADPNNYFDEATPPISWTLTGATQTAWEVEIVDAAQPGAKPIYDSNQRTNTDTDVTVPADKLIDRTLTYRVRLRVWDNVDRAAEGGRLPYLQLERDVTLRYDNTVTQVSNLQYTKVGVYPYFDLTWDRATMPDGWEIIEDGEKTVASMEGDDAFVSGTSYSYRLKKVSPRVDHTYKVLAKVNGKVSSLATAPVVTIKSIPLGTWLMKKDTTSPIVIVKSGDTPQPAVDAMNGMMQETFQPVGGGSPVLISQYKQGFAGSVDGVLADGVASGLTARTMRDRLKKFRDTSGEVLLLYMVDEILEVVIYNITYRPRAKSGGVVLYDIHFDFFEAD